MDDGCGLEAGSSSTALGYRIGGLFGILLASIVGFVLPNISRGSFKYLFFLFRTFAAGVVLAVGVVHVLPDAMETMSNPCLHLSTSFPWANVIATFSALFTFGGEFVLGRVMTSTFKRRQEADKLAAAAGADMEEGGGEEALSEASAEKRLQLQKFRVVAYTLEAGIIFHSIFVGISLGTSKDVHFVRGLTFALLFHQGFEAVALGSALCKCQLGRVQLLALGAAFAATTPVGIAVGMLVGDNYASNSEAALGFQGSFNSISAGILIYNGLVDLVVPAFDSGDEDTPTSDLALASGFGSMCTGAALMGLIAKWA